MRRGLIPAGMLAIIIATSTLVATSPALAACETPMPAPTATSAVISVQIPDATTAPIAPCVTETTQPSAAPTKSPSGGGTGSGGGRGRGSGLATTGDPAAAPPVAPVVGSSPAQTGNRLDLDRDRISAGEWMTATGHGFSPGEQVQLVLFSERLVIDSYVADGGGSFTARFQIPDETRSGIHTLEATGWQSSTVANAEFVVVTTAIATGGIPQVWWLLIILGVLLISLIVILIYFRRSIAGWLAPKTLAGGQAS